MARYIDADKAKELITNYGKGAISDGQTTLDAVGDIIDLAKGVDLIPTADVAEVVRCKDCKYCKLMKDVKNEKLVYLHCRIMNCFIKNDSFCSYGERKENV